MLQLLQVLGSDKEKPMTNIFAPSLNKITPEQLIQIHLEENPFAKFSIKTATKKAIKHNQQEW